MRPSKKRRVRRARRGKRKTDAKRHQKLAPLHAGDEPPEDMDAFRNALARRIAMVVNSWHGCPEPACRRHRCCMAPNNSCTKAPPLNISKEESDRRIADIYKALQARAAELGEEG